MATVKDELNRIGEAIVKDAIKLAKPNKKTGRLESSLNYKTSYINDDKFTLELEEVYYGQFLNNKTGFMDNAISKNISAGIESIISVQIDEILKQHLNI